MPITEAVIPLEVWAKIRALSLASLDKAMGLIEGASWKDPKVDEGMSITTAVVEGSKNHALKATMEIPYPVHCCFGALVAMNINVDETNSQALRKSTLFRRETLESPADAEAKKAYAGYAQQKTAQDFPEVREISSVSQFVTTSPSAIVAHREFLTVLNFRELPKAEGRRRILYSFMSPELPELLALYPEATKQEGWVRGVVHISAFLFEETAPGSGKTAATFVCHSDPMGKVPALLANSVIVNQAKSLLSIVKVIETGQVQK